MENIAEARSIILKQSFPKPMFPNMLFWTSYKIWRLSYTCLERNLVKISLLSIIFLEEVCANTSRLSYVNKDDKNVT